MKNFLSKNFKAIGLFQPGDLSNLKIINHKFQSYQARDLIVRVKSISVNPIDAKKRKTGKNNLSESDPLILGYDASGIVEEIGPEVRFFKKGDEVYYAGDINRNGSNSNFQLIDERIVSLKPRNVSFAKAAALPLTSLTAWESLIENMKIERNYLHNKGKNILIIGGAGGVGSIAISIAKRVLGLNVIATASREISVGYCFGRGADHVINHKQPFKGNLEKIGIKSLDYVLNCSEMTLDYFNQIPHICKPCSSVGWINGLREPMMLNLVDYFVKRISLHPEFMFSRSTFQWEMEKQKGILEEVKALIEYEKINTNLQVLEKFNLENLKEGHLRVERGTNIGKFVLDDVDLYFESMN